MTHKAKDLKGWNRVKDEHAGRYKMINGFRCEIRFSVKEQYAAFVRHGAALLSYADGFDSGVDAMTAAAEVAREIPPVGNPDKFQYEDVDVVHVPE